jgi:hypothetical protein
MSSFSFARLSVQERAFLLKLTQNPRRAFPPRTETVQKPFDIITPSPRAWIGPRFLGQHWRINAGL